MRIWRSLKAHGAATLRDGVYLLPSLYSSKFEEIVTDHLNEHGSAYIFESEIPDNLDLSTLFDRTEDYQAISNEILELSNNLDPDQKKIILKQVRKLRKNLNTLVDIDYFPNTLQIKVLNELTHLEGVIARLGEIDEPHTSSNLIPLLQKSDYQNRIWATRKRPWIDRLACAWLIQKFIDQNPTFVWLNNINDCPPEAIGFDFDGATFTHVNEFVSFEVLLHSFNLANHALKKVAEIVHYLDVGGNEPPEAIGFEKVLHGLKLSITDDNQFVQLSNHIFDGLYTNFSGDNS
jgi:hypothetical protein